MRYNTQFKHNKNYILKSELQLKSKSQDNQNQQNNDQKVDNPLVK